MIYLDNSATTRIHDEVMDAMLPWLTSKYGNASSIYSLGREARVAIEDARMEIAALMGAHPAEVIFTSGGTESNNTILKSTVQVSALADRIVTSSIEHHSVLNPVEVLAEQGIGTHLLSVDERGYVDPSALAPFNTSRTLISVMHVNNETGAIQPIADLRSAAPLALLHTDAVQAFGKVPVNVAELGVDLMTVSAHKIHGPKGIGAMFIRRGIDFKAHQQGGGQERNRRAGTEAVALIVGFQTAARLAVRDLEQNAHRMIGLRDIIIEQSMKLLPDIRVNTHVDRAAPHIVNVSFLDAKDLDGEAILQSMDMHGVAVSNGSACVSGSLQPSHVLFAMGRCKEEASAAVRFSVSTYTTEEDVRHAVTILADVIREMRVRTHIS